MARCEVHGWLQIWVHFFLGAGLAVSGKVFWNRMDATISGRWLASTGPKK